MQFVLCVSRIMKASEVKKLCKELKENKQILLQQEILAKGRLSFKKEKAVS
jgi:hypothetical protein